MDSMSHSLLIFIYFFFFDIVALINRKSILFSFLTVLQKKNYKHLQSDFDIF